MGTRHDSLMQLAMTIEAEDLQAEDGIELTAAVIFVVLDVLDERGIELDLLLEENELRYPPEEDA